MTALKVLPQVLPQVLPPDGAGFDYAALDESSRQAILDERDRIRRRMRRATEDVIEIGKSLIRVKDRLPHGRFGPWLDGEFGWTDRTAQHFMAVARAFPEIRNDFAFDLGALYALASDDVPEKIRDEFLGQAGRGERVTQAQVKAALARPPAIELQVNVVTTTHRFEGARYVPDPALAEPINAEARPRAGGGDERRRQAAWRAARARATVEHARDYVVGTLDEYAREPDVAGEWKRARSAAQEIVDAIDAATDRRPDGSYGG